MFANSFMSSPEGKHLQYRKRAGGFGPPYRGGLVRRLTNGRRKSRCRVCGHLADNADESYSRMACIFHVDGFRIEGNAQN